MYGCEICICEKLGLLDCVAEGALELLCTDQDWNDFGLETHFVEAVEVKVLQAELNVLPQLDPVLAAVIFEVFHQCVVMALEELFNVRLVHKGSHVSCELTLSVSLSLLILELYLLL